MAHLWLNQSQDEWTVAPLEKNAYAIRTSADTALKVKPLRSKTARKKEDILLVRSQKHQARWAIIAKHPQRIHVNGRPLTNSLRVLRDRDELRISSNVQCFFSTECLPEITTYKGDAVYCARCKQSVEEGDQCVICPVCATVHHQSKEKDLECWTYSELCSMCDQITASTGTFRWNPEDL